MGRDDRLRRFRLRLLTAFGVGMLPGLFVAAPVVAGESMTECYTPNVGQSCLDTTEDAKLRELLDLPYSDCGWYVEDSMFDEDRPDDCCYTVFEDICEYDDSVDCGCYGRPYVAHAEVVAAPVVRNPGWGVAAAPELRPELAGLGPEQRAALADFWADNGKAEHSSVAGFHRLCLELIAHGAPLELLERSQKAAVDELAHARVCFALASHYAGEPLGPGPMPLGSAAPLAPTLVELAVATAREGCLAETSAAWLASEMAASASDPAVRAALEQIAADEAEHAELAWATLRWAIDAGGEEVRAAVAEVFAAARPASLGGAAIPLAAHGMLDSVEIRAIGERSFAELLVPVMRSALAA